MEIVETYKLYTSGFFVEYVKTILKSMRHLVEYLKKNIIFKLYIIRDTPERV